MGFNTVAFLVFLPVTVLVYWLVPFRIKKYWLLAMSILFYAWGEPVYVFLMLFSATLDYFCGRIIGARISPAASKAALLASVIVNLGLLGIFKYTDFIISTINGVFQTAIPLQHLPLPIGISFYTFQTMSYTIDVYRNPEKAEKNFIYYALYVSFFPQLVAGPIERASSLLHQFMEEKKANADDFRQGFRLLLYGFFKKVCLADFAGSFVNAAFGDIAHVNGLGFWLAGLLFTVQIYCDFSGYSDIATGSARLLGIRLTKNFNRPLSATSFRDYGRRWHISLSTWFMEYVYIPLGGSRKGKVRKYINNMVVFLLSGLWHGANWTFVAWGAFIGTCTIVEDLIRPHYHKVCDFLHIDNSNSFVLLLRNIFILLLVGITSIFFRAQNIAEAGTILGKMFGGLSLSVSSFSAAFAGLGMNMPYLLQMLLSLFLLDRGYRMCWGRDDALFSPAAADRRSAALRFETYLFFILAIAILWLMAASGNIQSQFIYFQF
ncbi:MAG: MBOAT family protein [Lachnospiraceae bacterium]|nr:MBOAT family protein [Lachnospiraceae bacterium]